MKYVIFSLIALGVYAGAQYFTANRYGTIVNYNIWALQRLGYPKAGYIHPVKFGPFLIKKAPFGVIIPLIISFLSSGGIYFVSIVSSRFRVNPIYRIGRVFTKLTEFEEAKIAASGSLANILLAILIKILGFNSLNDLVFVLSITAICYMLPFPGLDGITVLFGSRLLYIFSFVFILLSSFLLNFLSGFIVLILALIITLIIFVSYFYEKNS